ncbi:MAG: glycosyltransferase family 2 protein [Sumerlaeia bacterium]
MNIAKNTAKTLISVVIPFYNEEENIADLAHEVVQVMETAYPNQWELLLVNDGSADETGRIAGKLAQQVPNIRALHLVPNSGQSAALAAGFRACKGRYVATLDGDGQNDPADIPKALELLKAKRADMVCGIRAKRADTWLRKVSSKVANAVRNKILKDGAKDTGCSLKIFKREKIVNAPLFRNSHRYYPALIQMQGGKMAQMSVNHRPRAHGVSKYGKGIKSRLFVGIYDLVGVYWLRKRAFRYQVIESQQTATATPLKKP